MPAMLPHIGQITLYNNDAVIWCQRVRIALAEVMAEYTLYNVDLDNKPAWYAEKVNPSGKFPTLTYGGPATRPDEPSPESAKLTESTVIVEFIADLFPSACLLPADPLLRARARLFVHHFDAKVALPLLGFLAMGQSADGCLEALEGLQALLPEHGFVVGERSIADVAVAPFLVSALVMLEDDIGGYPVEEGRRVLETLRGLRFARLVRYTEHLKEWPAFKTTFDETTALSAWRKAPRLRCKTT